MQPAVDKEAVHVRAQQVRPDERREAEALELVARNEAIVVVQLAAAADARVVRLLELLGQRVEEGTPARRGPEGRRKVHAQVRLLEAEEHEAGVRAERELVDVGGRLDRCHRPSVLPPPDPHRLRVRGDDNVLGRGGGGFGIRNRLNRQTVLVVLLQERALHADVVEDDMSARETRAQDQPALLERERCHAAHAALPAARAAIGRAAAKCTGRQSRCGVHHAEAGAGARVKTLDDAVLAADSQHPVRRRAREHVHRRAAGEEGLTEAPLVQAEAPHLGASAGAKQIAGGGLVLQVATKGWDARLKVHTVLRVQLECAIDAQHGDLAIVVRQDLKLHELCIDMPLHLHRELAELVDAELRRIAASSHEIFAVRREAHALARAREVEVLQYLNVPRAALGARPCVQPLRLLLLRMVCDKLREARTTGQVVRLHVVERRHLDQRHRRRDSNDNDTWTGGAVLRSPSSRLART